MISARPAPPKKFTPDWYKPYNSSLFVIFITVSDRDWTRKLLTYVNPKSIYNT